MKLRSIPAAFLVCVALAACSEPPTAPGVPVIPLPDEDHSPSRLGPPIGEASPSRAGLPPGAPAPTRLSPPVGVP
jgi:hypothetical protein